MPQQHIFNLNGRTALVTGASRGIGKTIAIGLARAGADIIAVSRSKSTLQATRLAVEDHQRQCHIFEVDVSGTASIKSLFDKLAGNNIQPDILVNNAGMEKVCPSVDVDEQLWDQIMDTNLKGAFFTSSYFARSLLAAGKPGCIINLGSLTSAVGVPTATAYTSSKTGILGMTRALSSEWSPHGIRVNAIGPGYFRTELTEQFYLNDDWQQAMLDKIPMNRFGDLEDLTGISVFLASDAASYITGQIFYVDGGYLASI